MDGAMALKWYHCQRTILLKFKYCDFVSLNSLALYTCCSNQGTKASMFKVLPLIRFS